MSCILDNLVSHLSWSCQIECSFTVDFGVESKDKFDVIFIKLDESIFKGKQLSCMEVLQFHLNPFVTSSPIQDLNGIVDVYVDLQERHDPTKLTMGIVNKSHCLFSTKNVFDLKRGFHFNSNSTTLSAQPMVTVEYLKKPNVVDTPYHFDNDDEIYVLLRIVSQPGPKSHYDLQKIASQGFIKFQLAGHQKS